MYEPPFLNFTRWKIIQWTYSHVDAASACLTGQSNFSVGIINRESRLWKVAAQRHVGWTLQTICRIGLASSMTVLLSALKFTSLRGCSRLYSAFSSFRRFSKWKSDREQTAATVTAEEWDAWSCQWSEAWFRNARPRQKAPRTRRGGRKKKQCLRKLDGISENSRGLYGSYPG